mgnify:CR=1 FL=1
MILLYHPMYSKAEINSDSNYVIMRSLIPKILEKNKDWHFIIPFPSKDTDFKYVNDGFFSHPNIIRVPYRISVRKKCNAISFDSYFYEKLFRIYAFDVVFNNLVEISHHMKHLMDTYENLGCPIVISSHHYVYHESLPYVMESMENIVISQLLGSILCDVNIVNSKYTDWMLMDNIGKYFNKDQSNRVKREIIPLGIIDKAFFKNLSNNKKENEIPIIGYNHRLQAYKNYIDTFELLEEIYAEGIKFKLIYFNQNNDNCKRINELKFPTEYCRTDNYNDYINNLARCDLNVTNSQYETFCIAGVESMALGQALLAPNIMTFPEITPVNYPYLFDGWNDQKEKLKILLQSKELLKKAGQDCQKFVFDNFTDEIYAKNIISLINRLNESVMGELSLKDTSKDQIIELVKKMPNKISLQDAKNWFYSKTTCFSNQSLPLPKLKRLMNLLGYHDDLVGMDQWFTKLT